jgi:dihydropteroate synthase
MRRESRPATMGVLNVTPDSFSDGGRYLSKEDARARIDRLLEEGATIIDVGGESTRPGARPVSAPEQIARTLDAVRYAAQERGAIVSIDTTSPDVAVAALEAGAQVVNDVSCLADPRLAEVAASRGALLVIMHSRGAMAEMPGFSTYASDAYGDIVEDVARELSAARDRAVGAGVSRDDVFLDPGLGFHKNASHSYELLARLSELSSLGAPLVVGASRKSFLARDLGVPAKDRIGGSIAAALSAARSGAAVLRVHDVLETRHALAVEAAIAAVRRSPC